MKKTISAAVVFIGWILSPFTWWNDIFVNIPLSYLIANIVYFFIRINFSILLISSYLFTNIVGVILIYIGGRSLVDARMNKPASLLCSAVVFIIFSVIVTYLDKNGKLMPILLGLKSRP